MESMRCSVRCLSEAQFGCFSGATMVFSGTDVLLSNGSSLVTVCSCVDQKGIHQFPGAVRHLMLCSNKRGLYALCENDGICYIDLPQHPRISSSSTSVGDLSGVPKAPPCICVIKDPCASFFLVVNSILVTVGPLDDVWLFKLYHIPEVTTACHRKLAEHCIPIAPVDTTAAEAEEKCKPPVLCCVCTGSATSVPPDSDGHYFLEPTLFSLLFGIDVSLVSAPVVICGLPDGRLCYLPFLPAIRQSADKDAKPRMSLLYSLEQPIIFIGTAGEGDVGGTPKALVAVGCCGKVLIVQVGDGGAEGKVPVFREYGVPGPVVCACISNTHLYYSTLSDLLALPLVLSSSLERVTEQNLHPDPVPSFPNPISLNICRLIALAKLTNTSTGAVQLVAMSLQGRLLCITLPQGSDRGHVPRVSAAQAGQKMKDLLTSIGNLSDRATLLKSSIQTRNAALKKLNQVFNISCQLLQKGSEVHPVCKPPVSICFETRWIRLLQQDSLTLRCTLENSSSFVLEHGWTLCIQMVPLFCALNPEGSMSTKSYSFPLKILFPGKIMEVVLPLASENELVLPLKVTCFLVYSLQSILEPVKAGCPFTEGMCLSWDTDYISLDLDTTTLDLLDCLQVSGPTGDKNSSRSGSTSSTDIFQTFLNARRGEWQGRSSSGTRAGPLEEGPFVAAIRVSSALLSAFLKNSGSLCCSLLSWLFSSCSGHQVKEDLECPMVFGCCPKGNMLKVMAKEALVEDLGEGGPILTVELQLESSSLATLCSLHYSILHRIQLLLKEVSMETKGPTQLQGRSLQQALAHAEVLLEEIQGARGSVALAVEAPSVISAKLLHVYQQLRTNPLVIL
ncbi:Fanconi anemia core complex-associated protein 100 [Arapaima gigas]